MALIIIPMLDLEDESFINVIVALPKSTVDRITLYDPADFDMTKLPSQWVNKKVRRFMVAYCADDEVQKLQVMAGCGDIAGIIKFLTKGWTNKPEDGPKDNPGSGVYNNPILN